MPSDPLAVRRDGKRGIDKLETRVVAALPDWKNWPRSLRRLYTLIDSFGASEDGLKEACKEIGLEWEDVKKVIERNDSFQRELDDFRERGYPKKRDWTNPLTANHFKALYAYEGEILQVMKLEDQHAKGQAGVNFSLRTVEESGYFDKLEKIHESEALQRDIFGPPDEALEEAAEEADSGLPSFKTATSFGRKEVSG